MTSLLWSRDDSANRPESTSKTSKKDLPISPQFSAFKILPACLSSPRSMLSLCVPQNSISPELCGSVLLWHDMHVIVSRFFFIFISCLSFLLQTVYSISPCLNICCLCQLSSPYICVLLLLLFFFFLLGPVCRACYRNFDPGVFCSGGPKSPILFRGDFGPPDHNHKWFWSDSSY